MSTHQFGGAWTDQKLNALQQYLEQYRLIFTRNERARFYQTIYVDAFAGTGERTDSSVQPSNTQSLFDSDADEALDRENYKRGSARIALELPEPFDKYVFVEKKGERADELRTMIDRDFPSLAPRCEVVNGEANGFLVDWCDKTNWSRTRAVVFLDPYGMQIDWEAIAAIGATKAIDLWVLFPHGSGVNRMLTRGGLPEPSWQKRLTKIFGTDDWINEFYRQSNQVDIFGDPPATSEKSANFEAIGQFFLKRLKSTFAGVAPYAKPLLNSKRYPMYLLCFAAGNKAGAGPAVRIANYLLTHE